MDNYRRLFKNINTFIFDYDGVLSSNTIMIDSDCTPLRTVNVKDGYALQLAVKKNYRIVIISGGDSEAIKQRLLKLGIKDIFLGVHNKLKVFRQYLSDNKIDVKNTIYMGDDIPDYEIMLEAGMPACPADASEEIKSLSKYISDKNGGQGCVRDIIEQVLKIQGKWLNGDAFHW